MFTHTHSHIWLCLCSPCIVCVANIGFAFELISSICANAAIFLPLWFYLDRNSIFYCFCSCYCIYTSWFTVWLAWQAGSRWKCHLWLPNAMLERKATHIHIYNYTYTHRHKLFWENMQQLVAFEQVVPRIINSCICESFHWRMPFFEKEETPFATPHWLVELLSSFSLYLYIFYFIKIASGFLWKVRFY